MKNKNKYILWFDSIDKDDIPLVGGKGANLGEMASFGIPVPRGFAVTAKAYYHFLKENNLERKIQILLKNINLEDPNTLYQASLKIKSLLLKGKIPTEITHELFANYEKLGSLFTQPTVAIRSSATAEDLPGASFAGQQVTFLNIKGETNVLEKMRECWASLFEARAIFYRQEKGFDHMKVGIAVIIQEMVPADISGVMFTVDPVTLQKNTIIIEAVYGLGEMIVQGEVTPDQYLIERNSLQIFSRKIEKQEIQLVKLKNRNQKIAVPKKLQLRRKLTDKEIVELARLGKKIHQHYFYPQDIEWTLYQGKFSIVQTRPVTTISKTKEVKDEVTKGRKIILQGQAASPGLGTGPVKIIHSPKQINNIKFGDILVTPMTSPDFVPAMKKVAAIVTDKGGQTSHAAIVSRELGIPCVVGTEKGTVILKNEQMISVNGTKGEIYPAITINSKQEEKPLKTVLPKANQLIKTATKIYVNLGEPELAEGIAQRNIDGVGLLRAEFILAQIGIHPNKIIRDKKQKEFSDRLSSNIEIFCKSFYPKPVIYRTTDFKTNEYRNLVGGKAYEPEEENPLMGFRGAFRYLSRPEVLEMELEAIKKVREKYNNLWLMVPFCRTPKELQEVKKIIVSAGLSRSSSFHLWLMVEIPSNIILLEDFIKVGIDGVSIGSNDLTMLLLGVDRDNSELSAVFNEMNPVVLWALEKTIKTCQKYKIKCSICGQAPSVYPDLVEKLIGWGIDSISVNPDAIERVRQIVYQKELQQLKHK